MQHNHAYVQKNVLHVPHLGKSGTFFKFSSGSPESHSFDVLKSGFVLNRIHDMGGENLCKSRTQLEEETKNGFNRGSKYTISRHLYRFFGGGRGAYKFILIPPAPKASYVRVPKS